MVARLQGVKLDAPHGLADNGDGVRKLWVDDLKPAPDDTWAVATTYREAERLLRAHRYGVVALDHDLGGKRTGYDLLRLMERGVVPWPREVQVISFNPVGRARMQAVLDNRLTNAEHG